MHTLRIMDNCQNPFCERPCTWCCQEIQRVETEIKAETPSALKATLSAAEMRTQAAEAALATTAGELATAAGELDKAKKEQKPACVVCIGNVANHVIMPCMHVCLCESCYLLFPDGQRCPMCRSDITAIIKTFS
jgi:hypothetical protein